MTARRPSQTHRAAIPAGFARERVPAQKLAPMHRNREPCTLTPTPKLVLGKSLGPRPCPDSRFGIGVLGQGDGFWDRIGVRVTYPPILPRSADEPRSIGGTTSYSD